MLDLVLPRTDAGVLVQAVIAVGVLGMLAWRTRGARQEVRLFVAGLAVLTVALFGLRTLH